MEKGIPKGATKNYRVSDILLFTWDLHFCPYPRILNWKNGEISLFICQIGKYFKQALTTLPAKIQGSETPFYLGGKSVNSPTVLANKSSSNYLS